jgi:hypothetical protein
VELVVVIQVLGVSLKAVLVPKATEVIISIVINGSSFC